MFISKTKIIHFSVWAVHFLKLKTAFFQEAWSLGCRVRAHLWWPFRKQFPGSPTLQKGKPLIAPPSPCFGQPGAHMKPRARGLDHAEFPASSKVQGASGTPAVHSNWLDKGSQWDLGCESLWATTLFHLQVRGKVVGFLSQSLDMYPRAASPSN